MCISRGFWCIYIITIITIRNPKEELFRDVFFAAQARMLSFLYPDPKPIFSPDHL